jgi:hypothetical protein
MNCKVAKQLVLAPILGGLFVIFLPFIGFAIVGLYIGSRLWNLVIKRD